MTEWFRKSSTSVAEERSIIFVIKIYLQFYFVQVLTKSNLNKYIIKKFFFSPSDNCLEVCERHGPQKAIQKCGRTECYEKNIVIQFMQ